MSAVDVLDCPTVTVAGRVYRVQGSSQGAISRHQAAYEEDDLGAGSLGAETPSSTREGGPSGSSAEARRAPPARHQAQIDEDPAEDEFDESIIQQEGSGFMARLSCDAEVFPFVIGKEGKTKKRIEQETGASLAIPRRDAPAGQRNDIVIRGPTKKAVSSAYVRTEVVIDNAVGGRLLDYTHFLSLPLANASTCRQFEAFRKAALEDRAAAAAAGLDQSVFVRAEHLHLTLVMLKLYSDQRRHAAQQVLASLREPLQQLMGGAPLKLHLQGLEYMNDDPSAMHVLYLKVADMGPGSRLERLCELVVGRFAGAGLLLPQDERKVKLHATVINTRYRKQRGGSSNSASGSGAGEGHRHQERHPFDGRALLQDQGQLDLGIHTLPALHLSQRGAYDESGYYHCVAKLDLPQR